MTGATQKVKRPKARRRPAEPHKLPKLFLNQHVAQPSWSSSSFTKRRDMTAYRRNGHEKADPSTAHDRIKMHIGQIVVGQCMDIIKQFTAT